jgi:hypothetical protein
LNLDRWQEEEPRLGRGRLLSAATLRSVVRAVLARGAVLGWAKAQVVIMVLSVWLVVWGVVSLAELAFSGYGDRADSLGLIKADAEGGDGQAELADGAGQPRDRLRSDLFLVPRTQEAAKPKAPKTNPVELLRLIQLQGVLGGSNPKAMVLYKQTRETVTVSVGDDLGEFEVVEIRERSVILKWRDELFEISL